MNVVVIRGALLRTPEERVLPSGESVVGMEVRVRPRGAAAETVPVACPGATAGVRALAAGAEVVVVGRVRRRFFRAGGSTQSRTEVVASAVLPARASRRVAAALDAVVATLTGEGAGG